MAVNISESVLHVVIQYSHLLLLLQRIHIANIQLTGPQLLFYLNVN